MADYQRAWYELPTLDEQVLVVREDIEGAAVLLIQGGAPFSGPSDGY